MEGKDCHPGGFFYRARLGLLMLSVLVLAPVAICAAELTATDCVLCHGTNVADKHHNANDSNSYFSLGQCTYCHEGVTTAGDCSSCHNFGSTNQQKLTQNQHHATQPALEGACFQCHSNVGELDVCLSCHQGKVQTRHHEVAATSGFACTSCHTGIVDQSNCLNCHDRSNNGVRSQHHARAAKDSLACSQCHSDINQVVNCQSCHQAGSKQQAHHDAAKARQIDCSSCHTAFPAGTAGAGCAQCHQGGDNRVFHHGTVATGRGFDCSSCHGASALNQLDSCRDCHAQGQKAATHHTAASAQGTSCSSCHTAFPAGTAGSGCVNCHQSGSNQAFHHETLYKDPARSLTCSDCHSGIVSSADSCASCHNFAYANPHHNNPNVEAFGLTCDNCHVWGFNEWGAYTSMPPGQDDCVSCHTNVVASGASIPAVHHGTQPALNGQCTDCHAGVQTGLNCSDCHSSAGGSVSDRHHNGVAVSQNLGCADCHGSNAAIYSVDAQCESCHSAKDGPIVERHHGTLNYQGDNCTACHTAIPAALACSDCHGSAGATTADTHHTKVVNQPDGTVLDCTYCHTGADSILASCQSCHSSGSFYLFPDPVTVPDLHHMTTAAQTEQCGLCHTGITAQSLDCSICHVEQASVPIKERHHNSVNPDSIYNQGLCSSCHTGADPELIACLQCHADSPGSPDKHHGQPELVGTNASWDCSYCHTGLQVNGTGCQGCHTGAISELHHLGPDAPLARLNGDCSACHQSVSSPDVCANCHQSSPHHTTSWAQSGDCAHCHTVPDWAQDRPKQAACRECHGTHQHDKGGPIQNYGACAACHNQSPFHASPGGPVGYTRMVGGKGKFAMFWNQYTRGGDEEVREGVSPNGEDMNDEGGRRWSRPSLSFNKVQIQHNGRNYTVPSFDQYSSAEQESASSAGGNLAQGKSASASRQRSGYEASKAVDGSSSSRWWTTDKESEWLRVNLNGTYTINQVVINWHSYYAREYKVQVSSDGSRWSTVREQKEGRGGREEISFSGRSARYVRIYCNKAERDNGFSIYELEVYSQ